MKEKKQPDNKGRFLSSPSRSLQVVRSQFKCNTNYSPRTFSHTSAENMLGLLLLSLKLWSTSKTCTVINKEALQKQNFCRHTWYVLLLLSTIQRSHKRKKPNSTEIRTRVLSCHILRASCPASCSCQRKSFLYSFIPARNPSFCISLHWQSFSGTQHRACVFSASFLFVPPCASANLRLTFMLLKYLYTYISLHFSISLLGI